MSRECPSNPSVSRQRLFRCVSRGLGRCMPPRPAPSIPLRSVAFGARRNEPARLQRAVGVVLFVALERGAEDADEVHVSIRAQPVPVLPPYVVGDARLALPPFP